MNINIDDEYIEWIKSTRIKSTMDLTNEEIESYVNEVLHSHRISWDNDDDE